MQPLYPMFQNPLLAASPRAYPSHVAIVGAGTIGPDIGYYLKAALPDITLTLVDVAEEPLQASLARYKSYADKGVKLGKMKPEMAERVLGNIAATTDYNAIAGADLVIEAATEDIGLKKKIFGMIEERVSPETVITSNTSSIPAEVIFADMKHPDRTTVTHFFAPAWRNPAVEVITWDKSSQSTVDWLMWLFTVTGKAPVVTADVVCFMLDRIFDNWVNECGYLLDRATAQEIDKVATEFVAAGPFWVVDMSNGNPIIVETNTRQMEAEGECYRPAHIFNSVLRWKVGRHAGDIEVPEDTAAVIRDRLLGILFSQSLDIIARGIGTAADLELGCELALGFTRGPLALMREMGDDAVAGVLTRFGADRPGFPGLGYMDRFQELITARKFLLVDRMDDVVVITIRRPAQLNALSDEVNDEILAVLQEYENDDSVTGFILTGYGMRAFCAGADIGRFPEMLGDAEASAQYARDSSRLLTYIDRMQKPLVAALNGVALGGGAELAMRCHDRVCCRDTYLQFPEVTLGILPGIGGLVVPYRKWPQAADRFTTMLARGERMKALEAFELGIVSAVSGEYPELIDLAAKSVRDLAGRVPLEYADQATVAALDIEDQEATIPDGRPLAEETVSIILNAIREGTAAPDLETALEVGYRAFGAVAATAAAKEGIGAFVEGRKPDFTGM